MFKISWAKYFGAQCKFLQFVTTWVLRKLFPISRVCEGKVAFLLENIFLHTSETIPRLGKLLSHKYFFIFLNWYNEGWSPIGSTRHCGQHYAYCARSWWLWWWRNWWNDWQGQPKYSEKTWPSVALSTINPTCYPDAKPGRWGGEPATNRLSYGMAYYNHFTKGRCQNGPTMNRYSTFQSSSHWVTVFWLTVCITEGNSLASELHLSPAYQRWFSVPVTRSIYINIRLRK
jgi:hypothetical protein